MEELIQKLRERNETVPVPLELPDEDLLVEIEEELCLRLPGDYKEFLLTVSDVLFSGLEPATVADPHSHTHLPEMAASAWDRGLPRPYLPVCLAGDDCYCLASEGRIIFWSADTGVSEDEWESIWYWAEEVWLPS